MFGQSCASNKPFAGYGLVAATNRDLGAEIRAGNFREDLYYRLCADQIATPSLKDQIQDSPTVFHEILLYMVRRTLGGADHELERSLAEVEAWIQAELPRQYSWPGNYRELEQCVRNILIRQSYRPLEARPDGDDSGFYADFRQGNLTAEEVLCQYAANVYGQCGSYVETARRLGLDRRTAKAKVEAHLKQGTH